MFYLAKNWQLLYDIPSLHKKLNNGSKSANIEYWEELEVLNYNISTVYDFWGTINNIIDISVLPHLGKYIFVLNDDFIETTKINTSFSISDNYNEDTDELALSSLWINVLLSIIGNQTMKNVCCVSIARYRNHYLLSLQINDDNVKDTVLTLNSLCKKSNVKILQVYTETDYKSSV